MCFAWRSVSKISSQLLPVVQPLMIQRLPQGLVTRESFPSYDLVYILYGSAQCCAWNMALDWAHVWDLWIRNLLLCNVWDLYIVTPNLCDVCNSVMWGQTKFCPFYWIFNIWYTHGGLTMPKWCQFCLSNILLIILDKFKTFCSNLWSLNTLLGVVKCTELFLLYMLNTLLKFLYI